LKVSCEETGGVDWRIRKRGALSPKFYLYFQMERTVHLHTPFIQQPQEYHLI
jgi:hypothetical protein